MMRSTTKKEVDKMLVDGEESKQSAAGGTVPADREKLELSVLRGSLGGRCCRGGSWCLRASGSPNSE
jgi:hypothetical protein